MLAEVCAEIKNWFHTAIIVGDFTIADGTIDLSDLLQPGQYFRIVGSVFNDGVYQYPADGLTDESFSGAIWAMAVPPAVIELSTEIGEWVGKYADVMNSPYASESVPNYSYSTKASSGAGGNGATWQSVFAPRLNRWRKIR